MGREPIPARATCGAIFRKRVRRPRLRAAWGHQGDNGSPTTWPGSPTCNDATEPATIDGVSGTYPQVARRTRCTRDGGRSRLPDLAYGSDDPGWFRDIVATVKLRPLKTRPIRCHLPRPEMAPREPLPARRARTPAHPTGGNLMSTRPLRLLPGLMVAFGAIAAGCSSAASLAPRYNLARARRHPQVVAVASPNASSTAPPALTETFSSKMHGSRPPTRRAGPHGPQASRGRRPSGTSRIPGSTSSTTHPSRR